MTSVSCTVLQLTDDLSPVLLEEAVKVLQRHGLMAVPTETFYALAASVHSPLALENVLRIKGRPAGKPLLVLIGDRSQLAALIRTTPPAAEVLMACFWPGPLTLVFRAAPGLSEAVTAGTGTIGVRLPSHDRLRAVLRRTGPVTGTSANRAGAVPPVRAEDVLASLGQELDLILDGGQTPGGQPSTVLDVTGTVRLIREGQISRDALRAALRDAGFESEDLAALRR